MIDALVPVAAVEKPGGPVCAKVKSSSSAQRGGPHDAVIEVDPVAKELRRRRVDPHPSPVPFNLFWTKLI